MKFLVVEVCEKGSIRTECIDSSFSTSYVNGLIAYQVTPEILEDITIKGVLRIDGIMKNDVQLSSRTFILIDSD